MSRDSIQKRAYLLPFHQQRGALAGAAVGGIAAAAAAKPRYAQHIASGGRIQCHIIPRRRSQQVSGVGRKDDSTPEDRDATAVVLLAPLGLWMLFTKDIVIY